MIVPFSEDLLEQLEWIAEDIVQRDGDAYVLPVTELPEGDEEEIRRRMETDRSAEYEQLKASAATLSRRVPSERVRYERVPEVHEALVSLGCDIICWRAVHKSFC